MTVTVTSPIKQPKRLSYANARDEIKTGDLIAVRADKGFAPWLIRLVTRSPYTHTGVAVWVAGRLLIAETEQGPASLVPVSQYTGYDFDVFDAPAGAGVEYYARTAIFTVLGTRITYAWLDLVRIWLHEWFRVPLPKPSADARICSSLSELIYQAMGWQPPKQAPSLMTPRDLVAALNAAPRLEVRRG
jgi:hypothetical protein